MIEHGCEVRDTNAKNDGLSYTIALLFSIRF